MRKLNTLNKKLKFEIWRKDVGELKYLRGKNNNGNRYYQKPKGVCT